jgi:hypothetical protein
MSLCGKQRRGGGKEPRRGGNVMEEARCVVAWGGQKNLVPPVRMRQPAARAGQVGWTATHFLSGPERKHTRTDRLRRPARNA